MKHSDMYANTPSRIQISSDRPFRGTESECVLYTILLKQFQRMEWTPGCVDSALQDLL